ncbi:hypothetical protein C6P46_000292 [Rhodotorula mucilaginosa]|uniref:UDP-galactose transporter n=1 Tax=Rhodotorula mucilaginosa TaxID=5537 RepID=A0A9P7B9A6_RHOMI|nr:hypothetical protein C6P46_000292 [Rhodotorula mucilaginosa]
MRRRQNGAVQASEHAQVLYNPAAAVFTAEIVKASLSLAVLAWQRHTIVQRKGKPSSLVVQAGAAISDLLRNQRRAQLHLAVPAALYALQNTLLYVALSNLDAATYQATYQLKLLTTAIFSILFFKHSLSSAKWFSLVLLTVGVAIVQLDTTDTSGGRSKSHRLDAAAQDPRKGFAAILAACISSGLAGAWFEWVLKRPSEEEEAPPTTNGSASSSNGKGGGASPSSKPSTNTTPSLWARNLQLAVPSLAFSFAGVLLSQPFRQAYQAGGLVAVSSALGTLWAGFTPLVWAVVLNQALGGLLVALVIREADSVSKGFATSVAIVLSTLASALLFGVVPGSLFMIGGGLVISSTVLYSFNQS